MGKRKRFPLLRTSLLKMTISLVSGGRKRASSRISNLSKFQKKKQKAEELLNMIFENSLPKGYFW